MSPGERPRWLRFHFRMLGKASRRKISTKFFSPFLPPKSKVRDWAWPQSIASSIFTEGGSKWKARRGKGHDLESACRARQIQEYDSGTRVESRGKDPSR